jgi:3-phosphoglycerate kinase
MKIPAKEKTQPVDLRPISGVNRATVKETEMSWKTLDHMQLMGKRVLTRVDINVPVENGRVTDTTRIDRIVPTVLHILKSGGTPILIAHFGRPKGTGRR